MSLNICKRLYVYVLMIKVLLILGPIVRLVFKEWHCGTVPGAPRLKGAPELMKLVILYIITGIYFFYK